MQVTILIWWKLKKITKDLVFSVFNLLNNYEYNDKELKIQLMGRVLQSLYGIQ